MPHADAMPSDERLVGADRVLAVLVELADYPDGVSLEELAAAVGSPKPTVHRALASLRRAGLARQSARGRYALGDEFLRLAFRNYEARPETTRLEPLMSELAAQHGETVHFAVIDGKDVVYRAKVDPPQGAMKLTSVVGGRNPVSTTAVGKLLLSYTVTTEQQLAEWLDGEELAQRTEFSITDRAAFLRELLATRARGYGLDDQENEIGINCIAVPVLFDRGAPRGAISVSAVRFRVSLEQLVAIVPDLLARAREAT